MKPLLTRRAALVLFAGWAAAMAVFAFTDLQISRVMADRASGFGRFIALYGEIPGLVVVLVALPLAAAAVPWSRRPRALAVHGGLAMLGALSALYLLALVARSREGEWAEWVERLGVIVAFAGSAGVLGVGALIRRRWPPTPARRRFAWVTLGGAVLLIFVVVLALKAVWGRVRFEDLDVAGLAFTPWPIPQGPNGHASFPSGHTAMGWLPLGVLLLVADARRSVRAGVGALVVGWGVAVAVGRVRYGAHYASDVMFSTGAALAAVLVVDAAYRRAARARAVDAAPD